MPPTPAALRVRLTREGPDTAVVGLAGELDIATGPLLQAGLDDLLASAQPPGSLVFDLSELAFTDVVGLGELLAAQRRIAATGGRVLLRRPAPLVLRVLDLLRLQDRLPVEGAAARHA